MSVELTIETVEETIVLELQDHVPAVLTIDHIPELRDELDSKVDKVEGYSLVADDEIDKLSTVERYAQKNTVSSVAGKQGDVLLDKSNVGLSAVDNTADADKPVSTAVAAALADKVDAVAGMGLSELSFTTVDKLSLDQSEQDRHTHNNKTVIDDLSDDSGVLQYKGLPISDRAALDAKVDKVAGYSLVDDAEIAKLATVQENATANRDDALNADKIHTHVISDVTGLDSALLTKFDKADIAQATGTATDKVMSQKAVTDALTQAKSYSESQRKLGENNVTQMWFINPHYEHSGNVLYVKPSLYSTTDNCFYVRDKRYPLDTITRTKFWADLEAQITPARFKVTSPLGVTDCIGLANTEALLYDHANKKIVLGERLTVGDYTCLVANNITEIGSCLEEEKIRDQVLARQLRSEIPVVPEQRQVSSTYKIKGIAHRGYSTEAPENTLPAYALAKTKGFEYVECDISFTSDSVPVLLHDETINRTSTGTGTLSEMTLAQVKAFDYGSWKNAKYVGTQIPTLEEFLKLCRNLGLHPYLEIKNVPSATQDRVESVVAIVNSLGMKGKVSYISFDVNILRWIKGVDGTARLGLVGGAGESSSNLAITLKTSANDVFVDGVYTDVTEARVLYAISKNLGFEVWTVNDPALVRGLADIGVTGITTDGLDIDAIIAASYT